MSSLGVIILFSFFPLRRVLKACYFYFGCKSSPSVLSLKLSYSGIVMIWKFIDYSTQPVSFMRLLLVLMRWAIHPQSDKYSIFCSAGLSEIWFSIFNTWICLGFVACMIVCASNLIFYSKWLSYYSTWFDKIGCVCGRVAIDSTQSVNTPSLVLALESELFPVFTFFMPGFLGRPIIYLFV